MNRFLPYLLIALGASLWGAIGLFVRGLTDIGFTEMEIVTVRVVAAAIILASIGALFYRPQLKASPRDIPLFIGTGLLSIVFFNWCYFTAINELNISLAVALLYTAPAFVTILSRIFLGESLYPRKVIAVIATIIGSALIAGAFNSSGSEIPILGILIGLGAGVGYALYSIFAKVAMRNYSPFTVIFYTFLVASACLIPVSGLWGKADLLFRTDSLLYIFGLGLFPTVLAYFVYSAGLEKTESSKAAVIATFEPVVATAIGILVFHETLGSFQLAGMVLIISGVLLINKNSIKTKSTVHM